MSSIPYSRYLVGTVPWYSALIVAGVILAIVIASLEEKRSGLPKDTIIDLALWLLPFGIIGARIYYVIFSWDQFRDNILSVLKIWEGGIAIYGGVIAGLLVLLVFSRKRRLPFLTICDVIAPGLVLAQSIGRWGNWFNIEAYGFTISNPDLCFFPLSVQVPADHYNWHLATFFFESVWDFLIFLFLIIARHRLFRRQGDVFFFYLFLYGAGRLIIEEMRVDSLYALSGVRVSQLLSAIICTAVYMRFTLLLHRRSKIISPARILLFSVPLALSVFILIYTLFGSLFSFLSRYAVILFLSVYSLIMIIFLISAYLLSSHPEVHNADNKA